MKLIFMGANEQEIPFIIRWGERHQIAIEVVSENLSLENSHKTKGYDGICFYPNQEMATDPRLYQALKENGIKVLSVKSTGVDGINFDFARQYQLTVTNVPAYSPTSVGHFAIMLILMTLRQVPNYLSESNRKAHMGRELSDVTVGILGTGRIGSLVADNLLAMGANVIACGNQENINLKTKGMSYVNFDTLLEKSDVISIHIPASTQNYHLLSTDVFHKMKADVMLINTARGAIIDTQALIPFLEAGKIGGLGIDALEDEAQYFSGKWTENPLAQRLLAFENVIITPHIAYFTDLAVREIVETALDNAVAIINNEENLNIVA